MSSIASSDDVDHFGTGELHYEREEWAAAAQSFEEAIRREDDLGAYQYLSRCHLEMHFSEQAEYHRTRQGSTGRERYEMAMEVAVEAERKFGEDQWEVKFHGARADPQPYFLLAELLSRQLQHTLACSYLSKAISHPSFASSTSEDKEAVRSLLESIADARHALYVPSATPPVTAPRTPAPQRSAFERIISSDILFYLVEVGRKGDPGLAVRLSGVSRYLRGLIISRKGLWQSLLVGEGPHAKLEHKVKTHLDRCGPGDGGEGDGGGLKELIISEHFDQESASRLALLLAPQARNIQRLDFRAYNFDNPIMLLFRHAMCNLRSLKVWARDELPTTDRLDFHLLPPGSSCLTELSIADVEYNYECHLPRADRRYESKWVEEPAIQFANLKILQLHHCILHHPVADLRELLQFTPNITAVDLEDSIFTSFHAQDWPAPYAACTRKLQLEHLESWSMGFCQMDEGDSIGPMPFHDISAPNLAHLSLQLLRWAHWGIIEMLQSDGLREALPKLRTLFANGFKVPDELTAIFRRMTSLETLQIPKSTLALTALRDLESRDRDGVPGMYPNIRAVWIGQ